jgi:hypothetical protein
MEIRPLAVGVLGLIATSGIVYGAVSSVEPVSVTLTPTNHSGSSSTLPSTSFPILESPVTSTPVEVSPSPSASSVGESAAPLYQQLEGTWSSGVMTVTFNWDKGIYSGVMMGQPFSKSLEFVREQDNAVVFKANGSEIICQFQADGAIALVMQGEGDLPIILRKPS